jgi:C1A family cysteine protease
MRNRFITVIILVASFICFSIYPAQAQKLQDSPDELIKIKEKIKEKNAKWQAGKTSVSDLSQEEKEKRANLLKGPILSIEAPSQTAVVLPVAFNWRNNNGNYVTPVKNQGSCGSCWDFAATATAESATLIGNLTPYTQNPLDLSEQVVLSCSGAGSCGGGWTSGAGNFLIKTGTPLESCYPYTATNGACTSACANWQNAAYKIGAQTPISSDVTAIKNALVTYGPVAVTFTVYNDFYYYVSGVYTYTSGSYIGGHAVSVVGYDDVTQSFLVKNSWGTGWGEQGFFRIAYSEVNGPTSFAGSADAYSLYVPPPIKDTTSPQASIISPIVNVSVSGVVTVNATATDNIGVSRVELYANDVLIGSDANSPYSFAWNTLSAANGSVSLVASAYDAAGNKGNSQPVTVNVYNIPDTISPSVSIKYPVNGTTVSATVSISASASDNVGVTSMRILVDNALVKTSTSGTISYGWNTRKMADGYHVIVVEALDTAGNKGTVSANVTVKNSRK